MAELVEIARGLTAGELLDVWERGMQRGPLQRALVVLACGAASLDWEQSARLPIGARNRALLELRGRTFGSIVTAAARCTDCDQRLETSFTIDDLLVDLAPIENLPAITADGWRVEFRLPTSVDVAAVADEIDAQTAAARMLRACLVRVEDGSGVRRAEALPDAVYEEVARAMAAADPCAEILVALECPQCGNRWQLAFDVVSFFWSEIAEHVHGLFEEIDVLARTYGWGEADILAMSARRRRQYLEMATDAH
jgi:hypothetical protein